jgi:hypothetical protein
MFPNGIFNIFFELQMMAVLGAGMTLLRRCRVNAALTIQLFSQLFHFINMAIFNKVGGDFPLFSSWLLLDSWILCILYYNDGKLTGG